MSEVLALFLREARPSMAKDKQSPAIHTPPAMGIYNQ